MAVNAPAAYGLFSQETALQDVVRALNQAGFANRDICLMLAPSHPIASVVRDATLFNNERAVNRAIANTIGWLSEFGAVLIPRVGFFIRSQAYFHALVASDEASSFCGNACALIGLGFSREAAEKYASHLSKLGVMIYVSCSEGTATRTASELLRSSGAQESATILAAIPSGKSTGVAAVA